jgi:hypothetical protein
MTFGCDHSATKATLASFVGATSRHKIQGDGEGGFMLLGNCGGCSSTLAVAIDLMRGHVVGGEIETYRGGLRIDPPKSDEEPPF